LELHALRDEHGDVCAQISELEERLALLRTRRSQLENDMGTLVNRREAGLSGYRGALKEVDSQIAALLRRPPVQPVDVAALAAASGEAGGDDASPGGLEFLRLRPERRTIGMATDWWAKEVELLEKRKAAVDMERRALEEGAEVWSEAVKLVSGFEADLRMQMKSPEETRVANGAGYETEENPLGLQSKKMRAVITGLEDLLQTVERRSWNLLICAIGAELEAFREAHMMLREALAASGLDTDEDATPRLARSATTGAGQISAGWQQEGDSRGRENNKGGHNALVDLQDDNRTAEDEKPAPDGSAAAPEDLSLRSDERATDGDSVPSLERDDSENEIPPEFLMHHGPEDTG
jgi:hypothetical protein